MTNKINILDKSISQRENTRVAEKISETRKYIPKTGIGNALKRFVNPSASDVKVEVVQEPTKPSDSFTLTGVKLTSKESLTPISVNQLRVSFNPAQYLTKLRNHNLPSRIALSPVVVDIDSTGAMTVNGTAFAPLSGTWTDAFKVRGVDVTPGDNLALVGFSLKVVRRDLMSGASSLRVRLGESATATPVVDDTYSRLDEAMKLNGYALLSYLCYTTEAILDVDGTLTHLTPAAPNQPVGASMSTEVKQVVLDVKPAHSPNMFLGITGNNVTVYIYPVIATKETANALEAASVATPENLSGLFTEYL